MAISPALPIFRSQHLLFTRRPGIITAKSFQKNTVGSDSKEKLNGQLPKNQDGSINWYLIQFPEKVSLETILAAKEEINYAAYLLTVKKERS